MMMPDSLKVSIEQGDVGSLSAWHQGGGSIDVRDAKGRTPLMLGCALGHLPIIEACLEMGADLQLQQYQGTTALMFASLAGKVSWHPSCPSYAQWISRTLPPTQVDVARRLLLAGALISTRDTRGLTAMDYAELKGQAEVAALLRSPTGTPTPEREHEDWSTCHEYPTAFLCCREHQPFVLRL